MYDKRVKLIKESLNSLGYDVREDIGTYNYNLIVTLKLECDIAFMVEIREEEIFTNMLDGELVARVVASMNRMIMNRLVLKE